VTQRLDDQMDAASDPVIEVYKKAVDRTPLRENLKLTVEQRIDKLQRTAADVEAVRRARRPDAATAVRESAPPTYGGDAVIEVYKKDVDRTLLRENLKLTVEQRIDQLQAFTAFLDEIRAAARGPR
jgi:hypothetical protein